jgi:adenylate cyclase
MYTDMVGYTALGQRNESLSLALVEEQRKLIRPILTRHNGREVKTMGDAFLVEFPNALDAVRCAYDIQRATREYNISLPTERRIHLRVGLHLGDVVESRGDISGDAVNVASRIEPLAEDGGVCLTRQVYDHVSKKFELEMSSLGPKTLKNVIEPLEVYRVVMPWETAPLAKEGELDIRRVAVLPFVSMSPDPNDEYFADGLTEELIARLSLLKGTEVIARTSIMNYKKKEKSASQIGKELGAGTLLEGSVRKVGDKIRVTAQLINSNTEAHLWADSYNGNLEDVFAVQGAIAEKVAKSLELKLGDALKEQFKRMEADNPEAYVEYLRGQHLFNRYDEDSIRGAIRHFERALELEPNYSAAMAYLSMCYGNLGYLASEPMNRVFPKAKELAQRALDLDETSPEAHCSLSMTSFFDCDWPRSEAEVRRALEVNPSYANAHLFYAVILRNFGPIERAVSEIRRALELDPLSFLAQDIAGDILSAAKLHEEALAHFRNALELEPQVPIAHSDFGWGLISMGRVEEGVQEVERATTLSGGGVFYKGNLGCAYAVAGRKDDALRIVEEMKRAAGTVPGAARGLAGIYGLLKDKENALNWLEIAYREHSLVANPLFTTGSTFEFMSKEPRFKELVKKMGLDTFRIV